MTAKKTVHVGTVVLETVKDHLGLSLTILAVVAGAVARGAGAARWCWAASWTVSPPGEG